MISSRALLAQIVADYRRILGPLAVVALVNVGLFAAAVYPLSLKVAASQRRAAAAQAGQRAAERDSSAVHSMLARTEQADKDLARFYDDVLPHDVSGARRQTYARLAALAARNGLTVVRRTYALDQTRKGRLDRMEMTMDVSGGYDDIRAFLYALETAPEFVVVEDVDVGEGARVEGGLHATFQLATYFLSRGHGL